MSIKITDEPDVHLSRAEYERLLHEYQEFMRYYAGPRMSFETWLRRRQADSAPQGEAK